MLDDDTVITLHGRQAAVKKYDVYAILCVRILLNKMAYVSATGLYFKNLWITHNASHPFLGDL